MPVCVCVAIRIPIVALGILALFLKMCLERDFSGVLERVFDGVLEWDLIDGVLEWDLIDGVLELVSKRVTEAIEHEMGDGGGEGVGGEDGHLGC